MPVAKLTLVLRLVSPVTVKVAVTALKVMALLLMPPIVKLPKLMVGRLDMVWTAAGSMMTRSPAIGTVLPDQLVPVVQLKVPVVDGNQVLVLARASVGIRLTKDASMTTKRV